MTTCGPQPDPVDRRREASLVLWGPARSGRELEVVVLDGEPDEELVIIKAMPHRQKFLALLEVIQMPRTRAQLELAVAKTETWLEALDPAALGSPDSDEADLRAIGEAMLAVATVDLTLAERVGAAREHGRTWTQIAAVLGVSKQAARERFGEQLTTDSS